LCNSEDPNSGCSECDKILESNKTEADFKCAGLSNNYPDLKVIETVTLGNICDIDEAKAEHERNIQSSPSCSGVPVTERWRLRCN